MPRYSIWLFTSVLSLIADRCTTSPTVTVPCVLQEQEFSSVQSVLWLACAARLELFRRRCATYRRPPVRQENASGAHAPSSQPPRKHHKTNSSDTITCPLVQTKTTLRYSNQAPSSVAIAFLDSEAHQ